ncbi:hypothetical protein C0995_014388, partial [Termitomyces sp. Mi166
PDNTCSLVDNSTTESTRPEFPPLHSLAHESLPENDASLIGVRGSAIRGNLSHHPPPSPLPQEAASGRRARHEGAGGPEAGSE